MGLHTSFGVLSEVIEQYESERRSVRDVETTVEGGTLSADLDVVLGDGCGPGTGLVPRAATLTDGDLRVDFDVSALHPPTPEASAVTVDTREVRVEDGRLAARVAVTVAPHGTEADTTRSSSVAVDEESGVEDESDAEPLAAARDESVPPYEDTAYLERLYDTCETFAEMSRRFEMDVSSETVRRYMIESGVHDPTPYDTAETGDTPATDGSGGTDTDSESDAETLDAELSDRQLVADGAGLPADLGVKEVVDAVVESVTVHEVHRRLNLDRERTRTLLEELNLLDLVTGRLSTAAEQEVTADLVASRIRERVRGQRHPDAGAV